jgi:hypothetical protein
MSFSADCLYMMRLTQAIELDTQRSDAWKRAAIHHTMSLVELFTKATKATAISVKAKKKA